MSSSTQNTTEVFTLDPHWFKPLGRLSWEAIPYHETLVVATFFIALLVGTFVMYKCYKNGLIRPFITKCIPSVDHKVIGLMYMALGGIMFIRGFVDALLMRSQQALAVGSNPGFLDSNHYAQIFTAHGVIMIFFVAMPLIVGLMNYLIPLQIGARDVSFPMLNNFSFWLTAMGAALMMVSLFVGEFAKTGWLAQAPLSGLETSPDVGVDYYIWALQLSGVGTLLSGVNLLTTIIKMRCPGMTLMKMPIFVWTSLCANVLIVGSFPILTAVLALLSFDRYLGFHFFTNTGGGNPMLYTNLIWIWGHPEVYILILPLFGVFSEVVANFSKKRLFGYTSMVYATMVIMILAYLVWLHHFFTMGSGASVNSFFAITTMIISIPTGAKIFNWLFTMYEGRVQWNMPMYWTLAFMITFMLGGVSGVLLAIPPVDFIVHNSLFLVAHFHNVIIGGVLFGIFAALYYWWPKMTGYYLEQKWAMHSFYGWTIGFVLAFAPLYVLGLMGATRRMVQTDDLYFRPFFICAWLGAVCILYGVICMGINIAVSMKLKIKAPQDAWNGRTLEWLADSPPKDYNFGWIPRVYEIDAYDDYKAKGFYKYTDVDPHLHLPKPTYIGFIWSLESFVLCFALIWMIGWLVIVSFILLLATVLVHLFYPHWIDNVIERGLSKWFEVWDLIEKRRRGLTKAKASEQKQ